MIVILSLCVFIFGLVIGSFLNSVIYRLEKGEKLSGRSYCPHCKKKLSWLDLIPVVSFLFLKGSCRYCKKKISVQYPIVEVVTGLIFILIFNYRFSNSNEFSATNVINVIFLFYIASVFMVIFVYDVKHYIIPDTIILPAILVSFIYRFLSLSLFFHYLVAALIASGFFLLIFLISRGAWMGLGDCKLAMVLGFLLGFPTILLALFLSFFFGAIIGLGLIFLNRKGLPPLGVREPPDKSFKNKPLTGLKSEIPFAPFLITGTFLSLFLGDKIIQWYLSLFS